MKTSLEIDLEELLRPISDDSPTGADLSFDPILDQIKEAREEEDASLDQGDWVRETKVADWNRVRTLSAEALASRGKDLQVAAFLGEALARQYGWTGATTAMTLVRELVDRYWEGLHPLPEDGDSSMRISRIEFMVRRMSDALRLWPLTPPSHGGISLDMRDRAQEVLKGASRAPQQAAAESDPEARAQALAQAQTKLGEIRDALNATPIDDLRAQYEAVVECIADLERCEQVTRERFGDDGPSWSELRSRCLEEARGLLQRTLKDRGVLGDAAKASAEADVSGIGGEGAPGAAPERLSADVGGRVRSRAEALARLTEIATFFRQTEPHSPVAYLLERAVRWGPMPLHQWLTEVLKDQAALTTLEEQLGLKPSDGSHTSD